MPQVVFNSSANFNGNIARTCAATGTELHLVQPLVLKLAIAT